MKCEVRHLNIPIHSGRAAHVKQERVLLHSDADGQPLDGTHGMRKFTQKLVKLFRNIINNFIRTVKRKFSIMNCRLLSPELSVQ